MQKLNTLRSLGDIRGYELGTLDGEIGKCKDFLFDDKNWTIRYMVADTRKWLPGRKVLISPISIGNADAGTRTLRVSLTKEQIKQSPPLDEDAPVSRQYEQAFNIHYQLMPYWGGTGLWGMHAHPGHLIPGGEAIPQQDPLAEVEDVESSNLRSTGEVTGYTIQAQDDDVGHIEDFIVDMDIWTIRYLIIDTSNWLPGSKRVMIAPAWADLVDWKRRSVVVNLTSDQIKDSPEFDPSAPINRELEERVYDYFGRPYYW